jgi:hypothetical protein
MAKSEAYIAELRGGLLDLHKSLMDAQRVRYEREHGRVRTPNEFLGLVLEHPAFAWLRSLSALIAQLDEDLEGIIATLRSLIATNGPPTFSGSYWDIVNDVPEVLVNHVKLSRTLQSGAS